ncbi:hypothetical protein JG687_00016160 [Phytophthora cactorum]|uniref:Uncharacterized protein n=1 Tax=Phytophthora cactorum TaxID=29920 RepID=A0A8T1TU81_9STRA|nr:hypothetical protein JG687_00016160 [Phytophthora cactorum]
MKSSCWRLPMAVSFTSSTIAVDKMVLAVSVSIYTVFRGVFLTDGCIFAYRIAKPSTELECTSNGTDIKQLLFDYYVWVLTVKDFCMRANAQGLLCPGHLVYFY